MICWTTASRIIAIAALSAVLVACARSVEPADALPEAQALIERGEAGEARVLLKNVLVKHPDTIAARFLLARIALDAGDVRAADDELAAVPRDAVLDGDSLYTRARANVMLGRHREVLKMLEGGAPSLSVTQRARLRAAALRATGAPADAIPELRAALAATPADALLITDLANALAAVGNLQQATRELDAFIATNPKAADALLARGELRLRSGSAEPALQDLRAALVQAPAGWPLVSRLTAELLVGEALLAEGSATDARTQLAQIERVLPGSMGARLLGARIALFEGRAGEASDTLQQIDEAMPGDPRVQYLLVEALVRGGNLVRATEVLRRRVQAYPGELQARSLLARLLLEQSRPDQVVELLDDVETRSAGQDSQVEGLLAAARSARAEAGASIDSLSGRLRADGSNAQLRAELAAAHLANGDPTQALAILRAGRGTTLPDFSHAPSLAVATEVGALRALRNERELTLLIERLVGGAPVATLLAASDAAQGGARNEASARLVEAVLQREPRNVEALLRRANLAFLDRRYADARAALMQLIELEPRRLDLRLAQARVAEAEGQLDAARSALRAAVESDPAALEPALALASLELRAGALPAALQVIDELIAAAPADGKAAAAAGQLLLAARRPEEARLRYGKARDQAQDDAEHWFGLGRAQLAANDAAAARESFARTVALRPEWLEANALAVRLALAQRDAGAARSLTDALQARLPQHPLAWLLAGQVAAVERRAEDASRAFAQSYALRPTAVAAISNFEVRAAAGLARPEQPLQTWLAREPRDLNARRALADYLLRSGREADAQRALEALLAQAPNDLAALNNLAWLLAPTNIAMSESLARRAYAIAPDNGAVADTLGWVLVQAGRFGEARDVLAKAVAALPDDRSVRYHYATALHRAGDPAAARQHVELALAGNTNFKERALAAKLAQELAR
jgi:putative PEP-CTERM system TPR-repeat lipoprotein